MESSAVTRDFAIRLDASASACLRKLAARYIWWKTPDEAMQFPGRVAAQVMNIGDWDDVMDLTEALGDDYLRHVLIRAEAGQFDERSWHFWHYRLGLADVDGLPVPPMRPRVIA